MNAVFYFHFKRLNNRWTTGSISIILLFIGWFSGYKFNLSAGEGIYLNSPYTIGFMVGLLSLSLIFLSILFALEILFKEWDTKFDILIFSYPISVKTYLAGKFSFFTIKTLLGFFLIMTGFIIGQNMRTGSEIQSGFNLWVYAYPILIFGLLNGFFVCSFLYMAAFSTRKKLLVVIGGLLLYILYMVLLVFSNSPFMAGSMPQSLEVQQISSILDPFGISAYFYEARDLSVEQKNQFTTPFSGLLGLNRIIYFLLSLTFLWITNRYYSLTTSVRKRESKRKKPPLNKKVNITFKFNKARLNFSHSSGVKSIISFAKVDLVYLFKSVIIVAVSILLLFFVGMEMYSEIDKGIRLPEHYASSGLLATSISQSFHLIGALILVYFVNDIYWRSNSSKFNLIEKSTYFSISKMKGHLVAISVLITFFTALLILLALVFQMSFGYFSVDWGAYFGVFVFNTLPLILLTGFLLIINNQLRNKYVALGISILLTVLFTTPLIKMFLPYPLFHFFSGFKGLYSDMNGYGVYLSTFSFRLVFGFLVIVILWMLDSYFETKKWSKYRSVLLIGFVGLSVFCSINFMNGYAPKDTSALAEEAANYEKSFRYYQKINQPTITDVDTAIDLYPSENSYDIEGKYILKNLTNEPIDYILFNFHSDLKIDTATLNIHDRKISIDKYVSEIKLETPLLPDETCTLNFKLSYKWFAVNGHQSFNAIISNGSFMRISNYFPLLGYQTDNEIEDPQARKKFGLGNQTALKPLEMPPVIKDDFIDLNLVVSTEDGQIPIGIGNFQKSWRQNGRNYSRYYTDNLPFRFAVASSKFQKKSLKHRGINIEVLFNEKHPENVDRLLKNAMLSLDYCIDNFGPYPFSDLRFVEVSAFTGGFAATSYPATMFMTENMIFHANLENHDNQDVINELAGHELSHIWWGNNQISPDQREGALMLTETLAMYTEMMTYKKMYGNEKMLDHLQIHQQIYDTQKGLYGDAPLYKVPYDLSHVAYSKGAIAMVGLTELIGEDKVNKALRSFLANNKYPKKPTSLDLLEEFYKVVSNEDIKLKIDDLFKEN